MCTHDTPNLIVSESAREEGVQSKLFTHIHTNTHNSRLMNIITQCFVRKSSLKWFFPPLCLRLASHAIYLCFSALILLPPFDSRPRDSPHSRPFSKTRRRGKVDAREKNPSHEGEGHILSRGSLMNEFEASSAY